MWEIWIPIITLIVGLAIGFACGIFYLRYQMTRMQSNPEMLQKMAKQMGYNMNSQQLAQAQKMMKNQGGGQPAPAPKQQKQQKQDNRNHPKFRR